MKCPPWRITQPDQSQSGHNRTHPWHVNDVIFNPCAGAEEFCDTGQDYDTVIINPAAIDFIASQEQKTIKNIDNHSPICNRDIHSQHIAK